MSAFTSFVHSPCFLWSPAEIIGDLARKLGVGAKLEQLETLILSWPRLLNAVPRLSSDWLAFTAFWLAMEGLAG